MRTLLLLCLTVAIGCHETQKEPAPPTEEPTPPEDDQVLTCEGDEPITPPPTPGACRQGWCWANLLPHGLTLTAVWASGPDSAWMVGPSGTIVHAQADALELVESGTQAELTDVWGSSEQDVWATGKGGTLLHWQGTRWQAVPSGTTQDLSSLTGYSANDVWAVDATGKLLHWNGVTWARLELATSAPVRDISSAGPDTVWATTGPDLLRCTLAACETVSADVRIGDKSFVINELLSFSPDEVFALSTDLLRWKDGAWSSLGLSDRFRFANSTKHLAGSGPEDLWVSAYFHGSGDRLDPPKFQTLLHFGTMSGGPPAPPALNGDYLDASLVRGLSAPSPGHLYVVTRHAKVFRLADEQWSALTVSLPFRTNLDFFPPRELGKDENVTDLVELPTGGVGVGAPGGRAPWADVGLFADHAGNTWVAQAWRRNQWMYLDVYAPSLTYNVEVWRVGPDGSRELMHQSEKTWYGANYDNRYFGLPIVSVHGSSERNIWVVDDSEVLRWDGAAWTPVLELPERWRSEFTGAVWTTSPKAAWIGLINGLFVWDGELIHRVELDHTRVAGLWASSSHDVWAVGSRNNQPVAYHFDGQDWSEVALPPEANGTPSFVDVVGRCESDVYVVGQGGLVLHWDGHGWTVVPMPMGLSITRAAKIGSELWLIGRDPLMAQTSGLVRHRW